ncbi:FecR family protein [Steroidobacter sp.]|uniref:FecR family protein n=1 Tax=Steroidobacter sp. TaxID=1978227 RepID=UPI001A3E073D|nr:FecR domain-containing protein [Steroidobacter sp.]MBL8270215.1 FecR domain-containing protein [Steroidobacter sp.]
MKSEAIRAEEAAGDWLARRDSGSWTAADDVAFDEWLNASTLNNVTYLRIEHGWEEARRLKALGAGCATDVPPPPGQWVLSPFFEANPVVSKKTGTRRTLWAVAATLLIAVGVGSWIAFWQQGRFTTPVGGLASVPMSDGSVVTLNTDTELRVEVTAQERRVNLTQGEAYFEVAKDAARPFIVSAGHRQVVAVGTKFSVRRVADDVQVVVTEGAVKVSNTDQAGQAMTALPAGTIARTKGEGVIVQEKPLQEVLDYVSWRGGVLVFRDTTLASAIAEFNRYNQRKIVIDDSSVAALRIAGSFRSSNVDEFVWLLEHGYPVRTELRDDRIVIKGN